jgi:endo-1,4-beta-xylanase
MRGGAIRLAGLAATIAALVAIAAPALARSGPVELGAAVGGPPFIGDPDSRYRGTLQLYDAITAENDMKMYYLRPARDRFEFAVGDAMAAFAEAHGQQVHGHTLVWCNDSSTPGWVRNGTWTRASLLQVMDEHITTVLSHYRGRVSSWDVVNEALNDDGTRRRCIWSDVIGPDWIELAFRIARRVDPNVRLFYNEVRADTVNAKFEATEALARDFLQRGVPLDGVGLQFHLTDSVPTQARVEEAIRRLGELGLDVHISELDVPIWYLGSTLEAKLARQAAAYRAIAAACQAQPACFRITTWGFTDRYTWRCCNAKPLAFDEEYRPKAAWGAMQEVLRPPPSPDPPPEPPPEPPPVQPAAAAGTAASAASPAGSPAAAAAPPPLAVSARLRRQRLETWMRRRGLAVVLRLSGSQSTHVELVVRLRGRALGAASLDVAGEAQRTVAVPLDVVGRNRLRGADAARIVLVAIATDATGRRAMDRSRMRVPQAER